MITTLAWDVSGTTTSVTIDQGIGTVAATGSVDATVTETTTFTLTATNAIGTDTETETVTITAPPPPPPEGDVVDGNGDVIEANYLATAASMGYDAGITYRFGVPSTVPDGSLPTGYAPPKYQWPSPRQDRTYHFGALTNPNGDPGMYSSDIANALHVPDDPVAYTGVFSVDVLNISNAVFGANPEMSWTTGNGGINGVSASYFRSQGMTVTRPICISRNSRHGWSVNAYPVMADGLIFGEGSNTAQNRASVKLPSHKKATASAMSNSCEFMAVAVWDTNTFTGGIAIIAMVGLAAGGTLANPDAGAGHPKGWWGEWRRAHPGMPNIGNTAYMKILGYVPLPDMHAPTSISFTTGHASWDYGGSGGDIIGPSELDINNETNRAKLMPGGQYYWWLPHRGMIVVASKSESKVCFVDCNPLFEYYETMYLTTRALYDQTQPVGDGALWPHTFTAVPSQMPVVVKTVTLPSRPTAVQLYTDGPLSNRAISRAWIAMENGNVQAWRLGDYPGSYDSNLQNTPSRNPATITLESTTYVGTNPTGIAMPKEKGYMEYGTAGIYTDIRKAIIVTCRGDRSVVWVNYADNGTATVARTMTDSRIKDPIASYDTDNHTAESYIVNVADYTGRCLHGMRYGYVKLSNAYPGAPLINLTPGLYEHMGKYNTAGGCFAVTSANIP